MLVLKYIILNGISNDDFWDSNTFLYKSIINTSMYGVQVTHAGAMMVMCAMWNAQMKWW